MTKENIEISEEAREILKQIDDSIEYYYPSHTAAIPILLNIFQRAINTAKEQSRREALTEAMDEFRGNENFHELIVFATLKSLRDNPTPTKQEHGIDKDPQCHGGYG